MARARDRRAAGRERAPAPDSQRVAINAAAGVAARAAILLLGLASVAITTRYLGPARYGQIALAFSLCGLVGVMADAGLTTIAVRELARTPERAPAVLGSALLLRAWLTAAAVAVAIALALVLPYPRDVRLAVGVACVPLALGLAGSAFVAVLQAELQGWRAARADVAGRAAAVAAVAVVALLDLGFLPVVGAAGIGAAVSLGVTVRAVRPLLPGRPVPDRALARSLLGAALPLGLVLAVNEAYVRADARDHLAQPPVRGARPLRARLAGGGAHGHGPRGAARGALPRARAVRRRGRRAAARGAPGRGGRARPGGRRARGGRRAGGAGDRRRARRRGVPRRRRRRCGSCSPPPRSASSRGCSGRR